MEAEARRTNALFKALVAATEEGLVAAAAYGALLDVFLIEARAGRDSGGSLIPGPEERARLRWLILCEWDEAKHNVKDFIQALRANPIVCIRVNIAQ